MLLAFHALTTIGNLSSLAGCEPKLVATVVTTALLMSFVVYMLEICGWCSVSVVIASTLLLGSVYTFRCAVSKTPLGCSVKLETARKDNIIFERGSYTCKISFPYLANAIVSLC